MSSFRFRGLSIWWWCKVFMSLAFSLTFIAIGILWPVELGFLGGFGLFCAVLGGFLNIWHYRILKVAAGPLMQPDALCTERGLFPWVRHPMYLGECLLLIGMGLMGGQFWAGVYLVAFLYVLMQLCCVEDCEMAAHFGQAHVEWTKRSTRLIPFVW